MGNIGKLKAIGWFVWWKNGEYGKTQLNRLVCLVQQWGNQRKVNPIRWLIRYQNGEYAKTHPNRLVYLVEESGIRENSTQLNG